MSKAKLTSLLFLGFIGRIAETLTAVLQRVLPSLLYTNGLRHDHERDSNGIQGKNLSLHAVQKGTAHTRIQKLPANSEIIHLLNIRIWKD